MAKNSGQNKPPKGTPGVNGNSVTEFEERLRQWSVDQGQLSIPEINLYEKLETISDPGDKLLLEEAIDAIQADRMKRSTKRYGGYIETLAGSYRSKERISHMTGQSNIFVSARSQTHIPTHILQSRIGERQRQIGDIREQISTMLGDLPGGIADEETMERIGGLTGQMSSLEYSIAEDRAVMKEQRRLRQDPQGRSRRAESLLTSSGSYLRKRELAAMAASGGLGTLEENVQAYESTRNKFEQANRLRERAEEQQSKNLGKINALYEKHAQRLEDLGEVIKAITSEGGSGGGRLQRGLAIGQAATTALTTAGAMGLEYARWTGFRDIQAPMQKRVVQTGIANLYNRQYGMMGAAAGGDVSSMFELLTADERARDFASDMFQYQQRQLSRERGWGTVGNIGKVAAGGLLAAGGLALAPFSAGASTVGTVAGMGMLTGGIAGMGYGGMKTFTDYQMKSLDINQQITAGKTMLDAYGIEKNFTMAMNNINLTTQQKYIDHLRNTGANTRGFGGARGGVMTGLMDAAFLDTLKTLSPQQAVELTGMARTRVGGAQFTMNMLQSAEAWQRGGVLQGAEYMTNMGALAGVGGTNADLETILRRAVEAGMDNSKNVGQMVAATVQLASADAKMGLQTSMGVHTLMQKAVQDSILPANMRAGVAASTLAGVNSMVGGLNSDIYSQVQYSQLASRLKWVDSNNYAELLAYKKLDLTQAQTLAGGGAEAAQLATRLGLTSIMNAQGGVVQSRANELLQTKRSMAAMETVGFDYFGGGQRQAIQKFLTTGQASGGYTTQQLQGYARQAAFLRNVPGVELEQILGPGPARGHTMNKADGLPGVYEMSIPYSDAEFRKRQINEGLENFNMFYSGTARTKGSLEQRRNILQQQIEQGSTLRNMGSALYDPSDLEQKKIELQRVKEAIEGIPQGQATNEALQSFTRLITEHFPTSGEMQKRQQEGVQGTLPAGSIFEKDAKAFNNGMSDLVKGIEKFNNIMKKFDSRNKITDSSKENLSVNESYYKGDGLLF